MKNLITVLILLGCVTVNANPNAEIRPMTKLEAILAAGPNAEVIYMVVRTYHWGDSDSYNDFSWGDSNAYSTGTHIVGFFPSLQSIPERYAKILHQYRVKAVSTRVP